MISRITIHICRYPLKMWVDRWCYFPPKVFRSLSFSCYSFWKSSVLPTQLDAQLLSWEVPHVPGHARLNPGILMGVLKWEHIPLLSQGQGLHSSAHVWTCEVTADESVKEALTEALHNRTEHSNMLEGTHEDQSPTPAFETVSFSISLSFVMTFLYSGPG